MADEIVRVYNIVKGFRHFFNLVTADIFPLFKDKLSIGKIWALFFESLKIQQVVLHDVYINMHIGDLVLILQVERNEL